MEQAEIHFIDDIYDATRRLVRVLGGSKSVGIDLRPEWAGEPRKAGDWLDACLNPDRAEKLSIEQWFWLWREGKRKGIHVCMQEVTEACEYSMPSPVEPEDVEADLVNQIDTVADRFSELMDRLDRHRARQEIKVV